MIAADTSTWISFLQGETGLDVEHLDRALAGRGVMMIPAVLTELLSDPKLPRDIAGQLLMVPLLDPDPGFWQRAGTLRAKVLAKRRKARLGDALIAQSAIDHAVPLLTRDRDFGVFCETAGLKLLVETVR